MCIYAVLPVYLLQPSILASAGLGELHVPVYLGQSWLQRLSWHLTQLLSPFTLQVAKVWEITYVAILAESLHCHMASS